MQLQRFFCWRLLSDLRHRIPEIKLTRRARDFPNCNSHHQRAEVRPISSFIHADEQSQVCRSSLKRSAGGSPVIHCDCSSRRDACSTLKADPKQKPTRSSVFRRCGRHTGGNDEALSRQRFSSLIKVGRFCQQSDANFFFRGIDHEVVLIGPIHPFQRFFHRVCR